jgi:hypothetical protein
MLNTAEKLGNLIAGKPSNKAPKTKNNTKAVSPLKNTKQDNTLADKHSHKDTVIFQIKPFKDNER